MSYSTNLALELLALLDFLRVAQTETGELTNFGREPRRKEEVLFSLRSRLRASAQLFLFKICVCAAWKYNFDSLLAPVPSNGNLLGLRGREKK